MNTQDNVTTAKKLRDNAMSDKVNAAMNATKQYIEAYEKLDHYPDTIDPILFEDIRNRGYVEYTDMEQAIRTHKVIRTTTRGTLIVKDIIGTENSVTKERIISWHPRQRGLPRRVMLEKPKKRKRGVKS